ncbi:MAG: hypothetical protein ABI591_15525 [Kofleriaceae bacterium]
MTAGGSHKPEVDAQLDAMEQRLARLRKVSAETPIPSGFTRLANEDELLAVVTAKPVGSAQAGFPRKEAEVRSVLERLSAAESRALVARINKPVPDDLLAAAINNPGNLSPQRRQRVLDFLQGARAREARRPQPRPAGSETPAPSAPAPVAPANDHAQASDQAHEHQPHSEDTGIPGLGRRKSAPPGELIFAVTLDIAVIPPPQRKKLPAAATHVQVTLRSEGDELSIDLAVDDDHWVASLSAEAFVRVAVGGNAAAAQLVELGTFIRTMKTRSHPIGNRLRINLWGHGTEESFAVFDLAHLVGDLGNGSLEGLRPVEAQLDLGKVGGVQVFADDQVKAATVIPGEPIDGWFQLPNHASLRAALGVGPDGEVWGGAFYHGGELRIAIKPSAEAKTGVVAHVDVAYLLDGLQKLGTKVGGWAAKFLAALKSGAGKLLRVINGALRFELPGLDAGTWFDFDLKLQLPKLWSGGGFDLSGLIPTGFHFDFGAISFGALPSLHWPWLHSPRIGGFHVPWDKLKNLLGGLGDLHVPKVPLDFGLHFVGDFYLGLGIDLRTAFPDLGDLAFGIEIDLKVLIEKAGQAAHWLKDKLHVAKNWVHIEGDGVLRIYDGGDPGGNMVGFSLLRLLDGAEPSDLVPTEMRVTSMAPKGGPAMSFEMGEAADAGEPAVKPPAGKTSPRRPAGILVAEQDKIAAPATVAHALALADGAVIDVAVILESGNRLTVWSEAPSSVYEHAQAVKSTVSLDTLSGIVKSHWPKGKALPPGPIPIELDQAKSKTHNGLWFHVGREDVAAPEAIGVQGKAGKVSGHVSWTLAQLIGATDWTALVPEFAIDVAGVGGVSSGALDKKYLGVPRFSIPGAVGLHHGLFPREEGNEVWLGLQRDGDVVAASLTANEHSTDGAVASIHLSFLLEQLKKLGRMGQSLLEKVAQAANVVIKAGGDAFAQIAEIAAAVGDKLLSIVHGLLKIDLGGGHYLSWNVLGQLPHLGIDLDLSKLIPEFNLAMPSMPNLSVSLRPALEFAGTLLGKFHLPDLHLRELLDGIPSLKLPAMPVVDVSWIGELLGLSINLGDLFGTGNMSFGFTLPLQQLLDKVRKSLGWMGERLKQAGALKDYVHLGADGVVRIFEPGKPEGTRVGFDLKKLFNGVSPEDLVPVEMHAAIDVKEHEVAELSYGDDRVTKEDRADQAKGKNVGKVLVAPPKGQVIGSAHVPAPPWVRDHLEVPANAQVRASLYLEQDAKHSDAVLFASVDNSDRGVELRIHTTELAKIVGTLGPVKAHDGIEIDAKASLRKGMLVTTFGKNKGAELHGHIGWRLANLLADPSMSNLVPDELVAENKDGKLEMSNAIDVAGLQPVTKDLKLDGLDWAKRALGEAHDVTLFAGHDLKKNPRLALASELRKDGTRSGVELTVDKNFVATIEHKAQDLADRTIGAANKAFKHDRDVSLGHFKVHATGTGITVERGIAGSPQYMFATFGWNHLAALVAGDSTSLIPDELRVGTSSMALEMQPLPAEAKRPAQARAIEALHPLLKEPLLAVGFQPQQLIDFDLKHSRLTDAASKQVRAVAKIWDVDDAAITGGREIALTLDLEALLAHLMPSSRKWQNKEQVKHASGTSFSASLGITEDLDHDGKQGDAGVEMSAALHHETKNGKHRDLELDVGWSIDQIIDVLLHMQEGKDGGMTLSAGQLIPQRIHGSFATDRFRVDFGNDGHASKYNCAVADVPGMSTLLGSVLDPESIKGSTLNLNLPSAGDIKDQIKKAISLHAAYIPIVGCSLGVPTTDPEHPKYYEITFSVAPAAFKKLLYLIPLAGEILKAVDTLLDVVSDPIGTAEAVINTPEALLDMVEAAPEVYGNIKKMGFKRLAMGLLMGSHPTVRQFVLASRIKKKMEANGWKPGDPKPKEWDDIPPGYLEWLATQSPDALTEGAELDALAQQSGIEIEKTYMIPVGGKLLAGDIKQQIDVLEHGFKDLSDARELEKENPTGLVHDVAAKRTEAEAEKLRAHLHEVLESGVKAPEAVDKETRAQTARPADVTDGAVNKIDQAPTAKQQDEARALFGGGDDKEGKVLAGTEAEAWIQTYAGLTQEQLGELLVSGRTIVPTAAGKRQITVAGDTQRAFVRALLVKRMEAAGHKVPKSTDKAANDAQLVAAQQSAEQRDAAAKEADAEKPDKETDDQNESSDDLTNDESHVEGKGKGKGADPIDKANDPKSADTESGEKTATKVTKGKGGAGGELRGWTLAEALHIPGDEIHKYVVIEDGGVKLSPLGESLRNRTITFNGQPLLIESVELLNIRQSGRGASRATLFMLSIDAGVSGHVMQEYMVKGDTYASLDGKVDGAKLLAELQGALKFDGKTWSVGNPAPFTVEPYTMKVRDVALVDDQDLVVTVEFTEVRTSTGYARVTTADKGPQLVHAGALESITVPNPNYHKPVG